MKGFWQIIALVLLALMVPATVCCYLTPETCSTCDCGNHCPDESPIPSDSCPGESIAHSDLPSITVLPAIKWLDLVTLFQASSSLNRLAKAHFVLVPLSIDAPPELRPTWVFVTRAALPVRAPSTFS